MAPASAAHAGPSRRPPFLLLALVVPLLLGADGCFEDPVREDLHVELTARGGARLHLTTSIATLDPTDPTSANRLLADRLASERLRLLAGEDEWSRRFGRLEAASDRLVLHRQTGTLVEVERLADVDAAGDLERFFEDTLVQATYTEDDRWAELALYPLAAGRTSRRERRLLERAMDDWTGALETYFRATGTLYAHLEANPGRARACFSVLLEDVLPDGQAGDRETVLTDRERALVEAVEEAMVRAWDVLLVPADEAYSINELSRRAFDPFPARLTVSIPGTPIETEGFVLADDGTLAVPGVTLWDALRSLTGVWLAPDPLQILVGESLSPTGSVNLDTVASAERRVALPPPLADEIRAGIEERLAPAPVYRVIWER